MFIQGKRFFPCWNGTSHSITSEDDEGLPFSATNCQGKVLTGLSRGRDHAELLHGAKHIQFDPMLHHLAVNDTEDIHACGFDLVACRGNAQILALLRPLDCPASDDLILFCNPVVNSLMEIWEGIEDHCHRLFEFLAVLAVSFAFDFEPLKG